MKKMLFTFVASLFSLSQLHAETLLYVSQAPEEQIQVFRVNSADGQLTSVASIKTDGAPGSLGIDPKKKVLYASLRSSSSLASYRVDSATGKLTFLNSAALPKGENAAFVGTDRTGRWLLSASYAAGKVVVHRLADDGAIQSPSVQTVETAKTAHSFATDPGNKWVFVPHVAPNAVYQFQFDAATGKLTAAPNAPGGAEKAGPRHMAFHPDGKWAYTSDESGSSVTAYRFDVAKGLSPAQTVSTLPANFTEKNSTADVHVHPNGKFVWVSNRGHDSLAGFAIDATSGKLTAIGQTPTEKTPRSFALTRDGRFAFGAGEGSGKLAVFRCDEQTGSLNRIQTVEVGKALNWVLAVEF